MKRKYFYWTVPIIGVLFCLWYIKAATADVVYSDYIRLTNSYLPDVWNPDKFFVADVLTRIPVNYISRIINVTFFGFSMTFDRILGILGLGMAGVMLGRYSEKKTLSMPWFLILMAVMFSLNKWEMLINGSGWSHFFAFGCFYYHYLILDRVWAGEGKPYDNWKLVALPFIVTLGIAGPYCAIYSVTLLLAYGFCICSQYWKNKKWDKEYFLYLVCTLIPLFLYLWSKSYSVEDHAGAVDLPLLPTLLETPSFFLRFFLKSFSSMVLGGEAVQEIQLSDWTVFILGGLVICAYLLAIWLNLKYRLYQKTIFPFLLVAAGGLNHVLILLSRWIFLNENYGMSSRYALQFQIGILGIIVTFALLWKELDGKMRFGMRTAVLGICVLFLAGNGYTTYNELKKAPYRKEAFEKRAVLARNFEEISDDTLKKEFEYRSGEKTRAALEILKEQKWNVFRD